MHYPVLQQIVAHQNIQIQFILQQQSYQQDVHKCTHMPVADDSRISLVHKHRDSRDLSSVGVQNKGT